MNVFPKIAPAHSLGSSCKIVYINLLCLDMSIASVSMKHTQYTCMQTHTHREKEVMNMFDWSISLHQKVMCEITKGYEGRR